ncbi:DUF6542 domain-containing protein [Streptomyces malaysiense]|uniref:DUF6542 domain-containing protein n=1 Tax=Streptomyces malaysiense TaxID=1428626 RepID=UPI000A51652B|nr:DUF6542 domain-containing protein [Streptomyces malaysiense]
MEQHRTRPPNDGRRRGPQPRAQLPPQARRRPPGPEAGRGPGQPWPARPVPGARLPGPRLTGLGGGLFCVATMFLLGCLDQLLLDGSLPVYGALFLPVCVLTALWVRPGDVLTAPVAVPIAFATGLLVVSDGREGMLGRLMGLATGLATQAGWLYGGTLAAGVIVLVRRVRWVRRRRRQR